MRILAVGAHPDDIEILCGGTIAKYAARGDQVFNLVVTNGDMGHKIISPEELAVIRAEEARRAAETLGAEFKILGEPDEWLFHDQRTRLLMIEAIRWANPDVIITHAPEDYHPDHRACSDIVFGASFLSTLPHIETEHPHQEQIATLIYSDTLAGTNFLPEEYVDITEMLETKVAALMCHESQVVWLREHDNLDVAQFVRGLAQTRGQQCGVAYAEGFRTAKIWPRLKPCRLLP
jgi:LmbE family N-acetylglucosaminyl deacetylase